MTETTLSESKQTIPRSARLPSTSPDGVRFIVAAVAEIAGAVSRERLASHLKKQNTGAFSRAVGSALLYGFIDTDADKKLVITDRGSAFVGADADAAKRAEREGIAGTGFGIVIKKLSARSAAEPVIALRLQEDLGVPEGPAIDRAALLAAAATGAGLVVDGNFDGGIIEDTFAVIGQPKAQGHDATAPKPKAAKAAAKPPASVNISAPATDTGQAPKQSSARSDQAARNADLPSTPPSGTKRVVTALAELAGPASRERVAGRLKAQLTGRLAAAIASAILYGFMEVGDDDKLVITERGNAFIGDDAGVGKRAQREAIMSTGFAATIKRLRTHKADEEIVSARLQEDLGLAESTATERAKALIKAATDAGLAADGRFEAEAIEDTIEAVGEPSEPTISATNTAAKPKVPQAAPGVSATSAPSANGGAAKPEEGGQGPAAPFGQAASAPLNVVLQIDASKLTAEEIRAIVRELRGAVTVSTVDS